MDECGNNFLELLRYVRYIRDEKVKVQWFLSGLPQSYELRTLEESIRKAKYCYEQSKGKTEYHKAWKDKKNEKFDQRNKGFKPSSFRNQQEHPSQAASKPVGVTGEKPKDPQNKGPLQCWKCGGPHMRRNCPLKSESARWDYNIQESETMGQVDRVVPRIYVEVKDHQVDHQSTMVEVAGKID